MIWMNMKYGEEEYEEMDEESLREYASMEDPRIVYALDCGPDELEDRYWLMHEFWAKLPQWNFY